jgi:LacI family transcriptional regulator
MSEADSLRSATPTRTTDGNRVVGVGRGRVTIYDIAQAARVAPSTVSRAFSNPGRLNEKTEAHVLAVAKALGYQLNRSARSLSTGHTGNLGMVAPNVANPFFAEFLQSFQHAAAEHDYAVIFSDTDETPERELLALETLTAQTDGILLCAPRSSTRQLTRVLDNYRLVVVNHRVPSVRCVLIDSDDAVQRAVQELAGLGHQRLVYARGPAHAISDRVRRRVCSRVAQALGLDIFFTEAQSVDRSAAQQALDLVQRHRATAVIAHSDLAALWLLTEAQERGLRVPDCLSVIGHDNIQFSAMVAPPLTTIDARIGEVAQVAAELLIRVVEHPDLRTAQECETVEAVYVQRGSVGPAPSIERVRHHRNTPKPR